MRARGNSMSSQAKAKEEPCCHQEALETSPIPKWLVGTAAAIIVLQSVVEGACAFEYLGCRFHSFAPSAEPALYLGALGVALRIFEIAVPAVQGMLRTIRRGAGEAAAGGMERE